LIDFLESFFPRIVNVFEVELHGSRVHQVSRDQLFLSIHDGRGSAVVGGVTYALSKGSILQAPSPGKVLLRSSVNRPLRYCCIQYEVKYLDWTDSDIRFREGGDRSLPFEPVMQIPDPVLLQEEMQVMLRIWTHKQPGYAGKTKLAFLNMLHRLLERQQYFQMEGTTEGSILECVAYIERHYQGMLERKQLAKKFSISSSYFSVLFKKYVGCSPVQYITKVRIEKAMELLKDSRIPVSAIAFEVGYNDPLYFTRVFSRHVGVTPKQFRERATR